MDYYPLSDLLNRSVALTDTDKDIVEVYDTDAYGNTLVYSGPGADDTWLTDDDVNIDDDPARDWPLCRFVFTGREYDPETEIYFFRARYYHPTLGRWLSRDPSGNQDDQSLYAYAPSKPCEMVDPSGLSAVERIGANAETFVVAGGGYLSGRSDAADFLMRWWSGAGGTYVLPQRLQDDLRRQAYHQRAEASLVAEAARWLRANAESTPCNQSWSGLLFGTTEAKGHAAAAKYDPVASWAGSYDIYALFSGTVTKKCAVSSRYCCSYHATLFGAFLIYNSYSWVWPTGETKGYWGYLQKIGKAKAFFWTTAWQDSWSVVDENGCDYDKIEAEIKPHFPPPPLRPPDTLGRGASYLTH